MPNFDNDLKAGLAPAPLDPRTLEMLGPITMAHLMQSLQQYGQQANQNLWSEYRQPLAAANDIATTQRNITPINQQRVQQFAGTQGSDAIDQTLQSAMEIINRNQQNINVQAPKHKSFDDILRENPNAKPEDVIKEFNKYKAAIKGGRSPQSLSAPTVGMAPQEPAADNVNSSLSSNFVNYPGSGADETYVKLPESMPSGGIGMNQLMPRAPAQAPPVQNQGFADQAPSSPSNLLYNAAHLQPGSMMSPEEAKIIEGKMALEGNMAVKAAAVAGRNADVSTKSAEAASYATQKLQEIIDTSSDKLLVEQAKAAMASLDKRFGDTLKYLKAPGKGSSGPKELSDQAIQNMVEKADKAAETAGDKAAGFMKGIPGYENSPTYKNAYQAALARQWQSMTNPKVKASYYAAHQDDLDAFFKAHPDKKALTTAPAGPTHDPVLEKKKQLLRQHDAFKTGP